MIGAYNLLRCYDQEMPSTLEPESLIWEIGSDNMAFSRGNNLASSSSFTEKLVYEYLNLNQSMIKNQENSCVGIRDDDIPF